MPCGSANLRTLQEARNMVPVPRGRGRGKLKSSASLEIPDRYAPMLCMGSAVYSLYKVCRKTFLEQVQRTRRKVASSSSQRKFGTLGRSQFNRFNRIDARDSLPSSSMPRDKS